MPPADKKLSAREKEVLAAWIDRGAPRRGPNRVGRRPGGATEEEKSFWSFQPIRRARGARGERRAASRNPIDAFLPASARGRRPGLLARGRPPDPDPPGYVRPDGPPADARGGRRLPGRPAPDAYERLVDRLLAVPRYGERWGRHWLDVAGYADSDGYTPGDDVRPFAYKYRDYLVRSLNADRPWDT